MSEKKPIRIELTEEQKKQILEATGKDASAVELNAEELEDKVTPKGLSMTAPKKASLTAPKKASLTAPKKASLTAPKKASLTAPKKASITAPRKIKGQ